jgi:hypothetical protein
MQRDNKMLTRYAVYNHCESTSTLATMATWVTSTPVVPAIAPIATAFEDVINYVDA